MNTRQFDIVSISIPVSDQQVARSFYANVLEFEIIRDFSMGPGQRWIQMAPRGAETSITLVTWFEAMPAGSLRGMVLATVDIDATRKKLIHKGLQISDVKDAPWGRYATFSDPDGNGWILRQA